MSPVLVPIHASDPDGTTQKAERWAAIWHEGTALRAPTLVNDLNPQPDLTLCLEFTLPAFGPQGPVRLWHGAAEGGRAIGLYVLPDGALRLVHGEIDLVTAPDLGRAGETLGLRYRTCARGRGDVIDILNHDRPQRHRTRAGLATVARLDEALPRDARFLKICHVAAIAEFGVPSTDLPGLASGAMVMTDQGPQPVETLCPGSVVQTVTGACLPLRWIERRSRLCLGRQAPVLLRAPYFHLSHDICVTPETRVVRSGPAVEYIFGTERVLVSAGHMITGTGALRDRRRPVRAFYHLMLDDHACVMVDRCGLETALLADVIAAGDGGQVRNLADTDRTPCLPVLDRAGAQALVAASAKGRRSLS